MLERWLGEPIAKSKHSVLVLGPRQTGKSTLLRSLEPDVTINLALESTYLEHAADPGLLVSLIEEARPKRVFIDEVQRLPSVLNTVQALVDDAKFGGRPLRFWLTGSSARKLKRGKANLLPGRVIVYELGPLVAGELDYEVDTSRALRVGLLPEPYLSDDLVDAEALLGAYAGAYVKEEVQAEALTRNIEGFSRFLTVAARHSGQFLDFSKLAQLAKVSRTSTVRFFEILEDTLLVRRATPYAGSPAADLVKHARFFFFDVGVLNALLGNFTPSPDRAGGLFEHLVFNNLHVAAAARRRPCTISNFRTRGGLEVDFIVEYEGRTLAIEAKSGDFDAGAANRVMEQVLAYLPRGAEGIVATRGTAKRRLSHCRVLPWQELLRELGL